MFKVTKTYNLQVINPKLAKEWHPTKNGTLTPMKVTPFSNRKVWWFCQNKHEWKTEIDHRAYGKSCPYCAERALYRINCLQVKYPNLSKEWHPTKNGQLTPKKITPGSRKKVWWICDKGHEWKAIVGNRVKGTRCPFCTGRFATKDKNLAVVNPELAEEWHPVKNGNLTPENVLPNSHRKVWWRCKKGHEWQTFVTSRAKSTGCPFCSGTAATEENNLKVIKPKLAKEWHPVKNSDLTPNDVLPNSHKKAWWQCKKGHEWQAYVFSRNNGTGCPHCFRLKRSSA